MKQSGKKVVWPGAIDSAKSRSEGRRLVKSQAIQAPRADELMLAAKRLLLDPELSRNAALPSRWWEKTGYVMVKCKDKSRSVILKDLAAEVQKLRRAKQ